MSISTETRFRDHLKRIKLELQNSLENKMYLPEFTAAWEQWWSEAETDLIKRYNESWRHYHNLEHIVSGLDLLESHNASSVLIKLAYVYHDIIYVAGAQHGMNERCSARYAATELEPVLSKAAREYIAECIVATTHHHIPAGFVDDTGDLALMLDIDLSNLGAEESVFRKNTENIYAEFMWSITVVEFETGSKAFAENMLKQHASGGIYKTTCFAHLEERAAANLMILAAGGFATPHTLED